MTKAQAPMTNYPGLTLIGHWDLVIGHSPSGLRGLRRRCRSNLRLLGLLHRYRQLERRLLDRLADDALLQTPRAHSSVTRPAGRRRDLHPLQIRLEFPPADARHLRADAAQIFRLAAVLDLVAHRGLLLAVFALRHRLISLCRHRFTPGF